MVKLPTETLALSLRDAAATIGISLRTLQKHVQVGHLPVRKIGRRTLITVHDLQIFLETDQTLPDVKRLSGDTKSPMEA